MNHVLVGFASCGHPQLVVGLESLEAEEILEFLREGGAGYSVAVTTADEFREKHAPNMLCDCPEAQK